MTSTPGAPGSWSRRAARGWSLLGIACQVTQLVVSIRRRATLRDLTGDPWDGRSLEWITSSPPPAFNFAVLPDVRGEEAYWSIKQSAIKQGRLSDVPDYKADRDSEK